MNPSTAHPPSSPIDTAAALALFDRLEPVREEEMLGSWRGGSFPTGHPLDGLLENAHWHGKRFESSEQVHPLVFRSAAGRLYSVDPRWVVPALSLVQRLRGLRSPLAGQLFRWLGPLLATDQACARLRTLCHRGVCSATMIYDHAPIHDVFHRLDEDTLLGLMDARGMERPFFFLLRREPGGGSAGAITSPAPAASPPPHSRGC
jgi:hypothetical protein